MNTTAETNNDFFIKTKKVTKKFDGIRYYSEMITIDGYRIWQSISHPSYKHFMKIKKVNQ